MSLSVDFTNKVITSDASITDMVVFHQQLRDIEASDAGLINPIIHTYKTIDLGGGSIFPAIAFINGWTLQFPIGNWTIRGGNLSATINPVSGCYVDRTQSAAYAVTSAGGSGYTGPTLDEIANAVKAVVGDAVWSYTK